MSKELIPYRDTQRNLAASTTVNNCSDLRLSAERADTPLVDMERKDIGALLFEYKHEREIAKDPPPELPEGVPEVLHIPRP
ncbi:MULTISPECIES: hypothetical protein [unclassified Natrinema]|uniref:hypothetical protein n=1 Tax=unclassified Natrinema TaxID=2622230 RepID=UPI00026D43BC|nr:MULTISPECIES: hypothetical protein [unclassified Natrinema]AFO58948.1 integrase family protein [Natrinema sp. J7-2]